MTSLNLKTLEKMTGLETISTSSVWNFHGINHLESVAARSGTNLNNAIKGIEKSGYVGMLTIYAYSIGRSQHSETQVAILKGVTSSEKIGSFYYSKRMGEVRIGK